MKKLSSAQHERQRIRNSEGRYTKNPCYCCGKSAPVEAYFSHPLTDQVDSNGECWADCALVLCAKCCRATDSMTTVKEYKAYRKQRRKA